MFWQRFLGALGILGFVFLPMAFAEVSLEESKQEAYLQSELRLEEASGLANQEGSFALPNAGEVAVRMFFFLFVVLGLIFGCFVLMQRLVGKMPLKSGGGASEAIRVLSHRRLDAKRGIYLVDVLGKVLVVGADGNGLRLMSELNDPQQLARAKEFQEATAEVYRLNPFQGILDRFSKGYQEPVSSPSTSQAKGLKLQIEQLKSRLV